MQNLGYQWWVKIRNAPVITRNIPLESKISFPVGAEGELRLFHYRVLDAKVLRPFSIVRAKLPELTEIELETETEKELFPTLSRNQVLGESRIQTWSVELQKSLLNLQPQIMERFPKQKAGTPGEQYLELFDMLTPDVLKPFYYALNPEYFEWLKT
ncbi:MAG: hypothetical protein L0177_00675 [Chloroflexi bacterium]|nr:hypothetical protein [Chloroflexota bacterium]